jgi:hypothetical protein
MNGLVIVTKGLCKGMIGKYTGKQVIDGKMKIAVEMDCLYQVDFDEDEIEFLNDN